MTSPLTAPSDLNPAGPSTTQRGIRLPQLLLSVLVVAVFALLAVWWQANTASREPVVALARDVQIGVPLTRADLTEIYVSTDVPASTEDAQFLDLFVGKVPVASLEAGTLVTGAMFRVTTPLAEGQAFVGLDLGLSQTPSGLVPGDRVQVLNTDGELLAADARVETATDDDDKTRLRLRMSVDQAQAVQPVADRVVVIEIDNAGPASWEVPAEEPS